MVPEKYCFRLNKNLAHWFQYSQYLFEQHKFLNHSCEPVAGMKGLTLIALRDIKEGDEITIDYSIQEGDHLWEMKCDCKSNNCRCTVRSVQFLPEKTFKKYLPYIPAYFKKVYEKHISLRGNA